MKQPNLTHHFRQSDDEERMAEFHAWNEEEQEYDDNPGPKLFSALIWLTLTGAFLFLIIRGFLKLII